MSQRDRDRDWLLSLIAAVLFAGLFALLVGFVIPWLLNGMGPIDWLFISIACVITAAIVMALALCGAAALDAPQPVELDRDIREPLHALGDDASALVFDFPSRDAS